MHLLDRYLARNFLLGMLPSLLLLGGLFSFLALVQELEDVGKGGYTTASAIAVIAFTLPRKLIDILPVIALLGALTGLGAMANHRETVAARAAGLSPARMALPVSLAAVLVIVVAFCVQTFSIPGWERDARQLRAQVTQTAMESRGNEFWTRTGSNLLRVGDVALGRVPTDIEIYQMDPNDRLVGLIRAAHADLVNEREWLLHDVSQTLLEGTAATTTREPQMLWQSFLSAQQLGTLVQPANTMAVNELLSYIERLRSNRLNTHQYRFAFWQMLSLPVGILAMAMLGVPFVMGSLRAVSVSQRVAFGGGLGMLFYLLEQVIGQFAVLYEFNPILAAMGPDLVLLALASISLARSR
ncbi:MAG: LPS export ABC transporter permease LptG [Lysobacterales bacterium]